MTSNFFPAFNAALNFLAFVFLVCGFVFIKKRDIPKHRIAMLCAFSSSTVFLISYLYYHFNYESNKMGAHGPIRNLYFFILISHIILAVVIVPLILRLLFFAFKNNVVAHKKLARFVFPMWIYTSVTGVLVYFFLYVWFPKAPELSGALGS